MFFGYKRVGSEWFSLMKRYVLGGFTGRMRNTCNYTWEGLKTGCYGGKYIRGERICLLRE